MPSLLCFKEQRKVSLTVLVLLSFVGRVHSAYDTYTTGCASGQYLYTASAGATSQPLVCRYCDPGYYCPAANNNRVVPTPCPLGFYSGFGATACTICPAGKYCALSSVPRPCPAGQYSEQGAHYCSWIPNGHYATELGVLAVCPIGYICSHSSNPGMYPTNDRTIASKPRKCRAGFFCFSDQMWACPTGTWSYEGSSFCTTIIPGQYWTAAYHPPGTCPPGYYQDKYATQAACQPCTLGHQCASSSVQPVACTPGTISPFIRKTSCDTCPAGFYCDDATAMPKACANGYYSNAGWVQCALCPAGYSCENQQSPVACPSGWYSLLSWMQCRPCEAGKYCPILSQITENGSDLMADVGYPITCPLGTYSGPAAASCTTCPAGTYCPYYTDGSWSQQPSICPPGMYSQAGSHMCSECPAGSKCINTAATPLTACTSAQITSSLKESCFDCPAGYACPMRDFASIVPCGPGFYSTTSMMSCDVSPAGFYAATTQSAPVAVSTGYYAEIGFTHQTLPHPGYEQRTNDGRHTSLCKPGFISNNGVCTIAAAGTFAPLSYALSGFRTAGLPCPLGTWALAGSLECHICMPGYKCNDVTVVPTTTCKSLTSPVGQFNIGGNTNCAQCPDGYECSKGETISPCPPWHYSDSTSATAAGDCLPCQDGYECSTGKQVQCAAGFYASGQINYCTPCPPGYYCPNAGTGTPLSCAGGYFSNEQATSCTQCPADYYSTRGQASCTPVPPGFYITKTGTEHTGVAKCGQTTYSDWGDNSCSTCPNGFLCPEKSQFYWWEQSCPRGSYCIAGVQYLCPVGTYGVKERATSQADGCAVCPPGYYCAPGTEHFMLSPCPPGAYCPQGSDKIACPSGTTRSDLFGQTVGDCVSCAAGTSCGSGDTSGGSTCELGYYCPGGVPAPGLPCPAGTYGGGKTGKIDPNQCLICPPGFYCPQGSATPTPAPVGYYSALQGVDSINGLSLCPPKYYCPLTGMTSYKGYYCTPGYFCPAGSSLATQVACPAGTFSDSSDIYDASQCLPCPRGFMCDSGATSTNGKIQVCPNHNFCELGSVLNSPSNNCPAGTYAPYTRSMSMFDCLPCPAGSFCLQGAGPVVCPAGAYCPPGTQKATQYPCKQGFYSATTGLKDATQCLHCGVGVSCPSLGMTAPIQCANGFYNDYTTTALFCDSCPAGYYCTTASIHPVMCGYGFYSTIGQTACTNCPLGHYCPEPTTTLAQMLSNKCPAGTICKKACIIGGVSTFCGLSTYPTFESQTNGGNACSKNSFCPPGTISEFTNITAQVTLQNLGSPYLQSAIPIPAGFIDNLLTVCPQGFYCPQGTLGAANQIGCPLGTYRADTMGMDVSDCGVCPAGYYCGTIGTFAPVICPTGFFCPEGTALPTPCPLGTFNALTGIQDSRQCQSCTAGHYCPILGQSAVDPLMVCDAGFICYGRAFRPEPTDFTTGAICPSGGYCLQGGTTQSQCTAGEIGLFQGAYDTTACVKCQAGFYCKGAGGSATSAQICPAGSLCPEGSFDYVTATPPQPGFYAPAGQATAIQCPFGSYQNVAGQASCLPCPQGFFCNAIQIADPTVSSQCPMGFYCPSYATTVTNTIGTSNLPYSIYPCPAGTYLNLVSKASVNDCIKCPPGLACETMGISVDLTDATIAVNYQCAAGFFCLLGSSTPYPFTADPSGNWGPCPQGSYCPKGTSVPIPCPAGKFSNQERAISIDYCMECPPGYICPQPSSGGLTAPIQTTAAGYLTSDKINSDTSCFTSSGTYCPLGSFKELRCPTGFYQDTDNKGSCVECSPGKYCMLGSQTACPAGYICP